MGRPQTVLLGSHQMFLCVGLWFHLTLGLQSLHSDHGMSCWSLDVEKCPHCVHSDSLVLAWLHRGTLKCRCRRQHIDLWEIANWKSCSPCRRRWPREKTSIQGKTVTAETKCELLWVTEMVRPEHCLNLSHNWNVWSLGEVAGEKPTHGGWETEHTQVLLL